MHIHHKPNERTIMSPTSSDTLVGAIALEFVLQKLRPQVEEDPDFRGAFLLARLASIPLSPCRCESSALSLGRRYAENSKAAHGLAPKALWHALRKSGGLQREKLLHAIRKHILLRCQR